MTELPESASWLFIAPVMDLQITRDLGHEIELVHTTLVASQRFAGRRRRFGLPYRLSEAGEIGTFLRDMVLSTDAVVVARLSGREKEQAARFARLVSDDLAILCASQLGFTSRSNFRVPRMAQKGGPQLKSYAVVDTASGATQVGGSWTGPKIPMTLDARWGNYQRRSFFFRLLKVLRKETRVSPSWRRNLYSASVLAGQSVGTEDEPQAFLWNMIILEMLLTTEGDRIKEALPERAEAFLGWIDSWEAGEFHERISGAYKKRNDFVHRGLRAVIGPADVEFTDGLVLNLLLNVVRHPSIIRHKDDVVAFTKRVQAERLLDLSPSVRPKTLGFIWARGVEPQ